MLPFAFFYDARLSNTGSLIQHWLITGTGAWGRAIQDQNSDWARIACQEAEKEVTGEDMKDGGNQE